MSEPAFGDRDRVFLDRNALVGALSLDIAGRLNTGVEKRGAALLLVSGGSTPKPLYERLSRSPIDWSCVTVVLVDERWVEPGSPGSNETFVGESLMQGRAAAATFVGLKAPGAAPQAGLLEVEARLSNLPWPADAALLGMGGDGHTASWFPHARGLTEALDPAGAARVAAVRAVQSEVTGAHLDRITLTYPPLAAADLLALMITGEGKRDTLAEAREAGPVEDMPVRALLRDEQADVRVYWAP